MDTVAKGKTGTFWTARRIAHLGTWIAFMAFFGAAYVMCAGVAAGFDVMQSAQINAALVGSGLCVLGVVQLHTGLRRLRARMVREAVPAWARDEIADAAVDEARALPAMPVLIVRLPRYAGRPGRANARAAAAA